MPTYTYVGVDADGKTEKGSVSGETMSKARAELLGRDVDVKKMNEKTPFFSMQVGGRGKVSRTELMHFSRQLSAFIRAGIPVIDAIVAMREGIENKALAKVMLEVEEALRSGDTFLEALAAHPKVFPNFYLGMIRSAELTGNLDLALMQLSKYIERDQDARRKIKSAMSYPLVVLGMALVTVVVLTAFVLPRFKVFFADLNAKLPLPTRMLLAITGFLTTWYIVIVLLVVAVIVGIVMMRRTPRGRLIQDGVLLKIPVLGETVRYAVLERFCRVLSSMVTAGVPLPDAMIVASEGTNNKVYENGLMQAREEMMQGSGLAGPIRETGLFPVAATQMLRVGEDTGSLDAQLANAAEYYELELDYKIKSLTALFEPGILIVVGLLVGFVAIALVSAMYGIFRQAGTV
ncbi:MAG: type II secretion system F family protein [Actinobacteria bacterium]|nr:type II secretion system F family protein [Actinomycetota bacterium]MCA1719584.1 type II secretion system F family protein [Actinomycetota bacterium]